MKIIPTTCWIIWLIRGLLASWLLTAALAIWPPGRLRPQLRKAVDDILTRTNPRG